MRAFLALCALAASLVVAHPTSRADGLQVIENCSKHGEIALTFDDGPYEYEEAVAKAMKGGKATFFLNGDNYVCIYDKVQVIRDLHAAQHTLGSHTWSHPDLTKLDYNGINTELAKLEEAFIRILGLRPLYFRPPYGAYNDLVLQVLGERGYKKVFLWSDDIGDANGESVSYSENVYNGILRDATNPHLVLDHSTIKTTSAKVLPYAVSKLQKAGYKLVAVDTCLGSNGEWPYEYISEPGTQDASWTC